MQFPDTDSGTRGASRIALLFADLRLHVCFRYNQQYALDSREIRVVSCVWHPFPILGTHHVLTLRATINAAELHTPGLFLLLSTTSFHHLCPPI